MASRGRRNMKPKTRRLAFILLSVAGLILVWTVIDLFAPRHSDLRKFDPESVARLETDMWRAYYERHQVRLFFQLAELLRDQYDAPLLRSHVMAFHAAKAAFVFKNGKQRSDYERALPDLTSYYRAIRGMSQTDFDIETVSRLELEWWIVHREREKYGHDALVRSLAELQAAFYRMPMERFMEHGQLRADAMRIRDTKAESGGVSESDWSEIHELLRRSWRSLWTQVQGNHENGV